MNTVEKVECPVCNGTTRSPVLADKKPYVKYGWFGYDATTDTVNCDNCGAQYQHGIPSGYVRKNRDGRPCVHQYKSSAGQWRCSTVYTCVHCDERFTIDSSD